MISLPNLPYSLDALEPYISNQTMQVHYTKHHATYVQKTNELIQGTPFENKSLTDIILDAASDTLYTSLFNNAAQSWNHSFFWSSLSPDKQNHTPSEKLLNQLISDFKSMTDFQESFTKVALSVFGSGWVWLVWDKQEKHLKITSTANGDTPLTRQTEQPLLCLDVWEHAYYLDYQNKRADYVSAVVQHLLNWSFASEQFNT